MTITALSQLDYSSQIFVNGSLQQTFTQSADADYDVSIDPYPTGDIVRNVNNYYDTEGEFVVFKLSGNNLQFTGTYDSELSGSVSAKAEIKVDGTVVASGPGSGSIDVSGNELTVTISHGSKSGGTWMDINIDADLNIGADFNVTGVSQS